MEWRQFLAHLNALFWSDKGMSEALTRRLRTSFCCSFCSSTAFFLWIKLLKNLLLRSNSSSAFSITAYTSFLLCIGQVGLLVLIFEVDSGKGILVFGFIILCSAVRRLGVWVISFSLQLLMRHLRVDEAAAHAVGNTKTFPKHLLWSSGMIVIRILMETLILCALKKYEQWASNKLYLVIVVDKWLQKEKST